MTGKPMVDSEKDLVRISLRNSYLVSLRKMLRVWAKPVAAGRGWVIAEVAMVFLLIELRRRSGWVAGLLVPCQSEKGVFQGWACDFQVAEGLVAQEHLADDCLGFGCRHNHGAFVEGYV